jgi:hypothetical protein
MRKSEQIVKSLTEEVGHIILDVVGYLRFQQLHFYGACLESVAMAVGHPANSRD